MGEQHAKQRLILNWKYPLKYGRYIIARYRKVHGRALNKAQELYGGSDAGLSVIFCTNQKRWRKYKKMVQIIEEAIENYSLLGLKEYIEEYFIGGSYERNTYARNEHRDTGNDSKSKRNYRRQLSCRMQGRWH